MPWFKVDDSFWSHPKTLMLSDAAVALWVRAGTYAAQHLTDGFVAEGVALRLLASERAAADELVDSALWVEVEGGWEFHEWHEYQPTREQVEDKRRADRERQRKRRRTDSGQYTGRESRQVSQRDTQRESQGESRHPVPSRPDPTPITYSPSVDQSPSVTREQVTDRREEEEIDADGFNPWAVIRAVEEHCGATITQVQAAELAAIIINRASGPVEHPTAFIKRCIEVDPIGIMRDIKHAS